MIKIQQKKLIFIKPIMIFYMIIFNIQINYHSINKLSWSHSLVQSDLQIIIQSVLIDLFLMKQKFWKQLKSRLCPRQNWLEDQLSIRCQCCGKQFTFFRRKHHCRFCGKIFCSNCSDLYINGTYLGLSQKYVRHCEFCKQQIQKIKQDLNRLTYMVQDQDLIREEEQQESGSSSDQDNQYFYIKQIFGSVEKDYLYKITEDLDNEAKLLSKKMIQRFISIGSISKQFTQAKLLDIISRTIIQSKMNILPPDLDSKDDYMDVNRYFAIKTITGAPTETIQFVKGIVLQKNLPIKGMKSFFQNPQIIVIQNSLDEGVVKLKFEELIVNSRSINQLLEQQIMRLNPDIIFVQKVISRQILKYFSQNGICIISGIKKKDLIRIAKISGIRNIIKNIWSISKYPKSRFTGIIDSMKIRQFPQNQVPFICLQKNIGVCSLIVSQRTSEAQALLKKSIHILLKMTRQIQLQKYLIYVDEQMWQGKICQSGLKLQRYSEQYISFMETMKPHKLIFYKVCLSQNKVTDLDVKMQQACKMNKRQYFFDFCGQGTWNKMEPYSIEDLTIGHFLLIMATNFVKKCSYCSLSHRYRYYFQDKGVQISAVSQTEDPHKEQIHNQRDLTIQKMKNYLNKYKQNSNIFSYFKCKICRRIISKKSKIGKNYLKNSFHYFLMLLSNQSNISLKEIKSATKISSEQCNHQIIDRFLQTSDILFRMHVFGLKTYSLDIIDLNKLQSKNLISTKIMNYIQNLIQKYISEKKSDICLIEHTINTYLINLQEYRNHLNPDQKLLGQFQKLKKIQIIIDKTTQYLHSIQTREKNKQVNKTTDWTYFLRQMVKIGYVIKVTIQLLIVSQSKFHKRKKLFQQNQNYTKIQSQQQDYLEEPSAIQKSNRSGTITTKSPRNRQSKKQEDFLQTSAEELLFQQFKSKKAQDLRSQDYKSHNQMRLSKKMSMSKTYSQLQTNERFKTILKQFKKRRYQIKKGQFLYFNLLDYKDHVSILAYALNSVQFYQLIHKKKSISQDAIKLNIVVSKQFSTNWELKNQIDSLRTDHLQEAQQKRESYELVAYFHHQFQEVRKSYGITFQSYVRSLACSQLWQNNCGGGKSNSQFAKSNDSMLIIKTVKQEQFVQFQKIASSYLSHIKQKKEDNKDSFLTKIYGIYELSIKGKSFKCVVMQNLFFNIQNYAIKVYDLKGSQVNRLQIPTNIHKSYTGLDTNFKIDKNHHPYLMQQRQYKNLSQSLQDDIFFLCRSQVIDYSLLVIQKDNFLRIGVIDFMRPYHFFQRVQQTFKQFKYGQEPTVLPPSQYSSRYLTAFKKYFMPMKSYISND